MLYGHVQNIPIDLFEADGQKVPPIPPTLWLAAEEFDLPPIHAKRLGTRYRIINGLEIWYAAQLAMVDSIPTLVEGAHLFNTPENPVTVSPYLKDPITEANAIEILKESHRLTDQALAQKLRWSRKRITEFRGLLRLESNVQNAVKEGLLSYAKAAELVSIPLKQQAVLGRRAIEQQLSLSDLRSLARSWKTPRTQRSPLPIEPRVDSTEATTNEQRHPSSDPNLRRLEELIGQKLGCLVFIDTSTGDLVCRYGGDMDILDGILNHMGFDSDTF